MLLAGAPLETRAKPAGSYALIVDGPGDKLDPSIDAQYIVFSSNAGGDRDVLLYEIGPAGGNVRTLAGGPGDQDQPSIYRSTLAYRTPDGIALSSWDSGRPLRVPDPAAPPDPARRCQPLDPVSQPVVSDVLAAWECGVAPARTVVVARYRGGLEEYDVATTGDVFGAAVHGALVGYVDAADGSAWLHDSTPTSRGTTRVCEGRATGIAVGDVAGLPVVAVARASGKPDADIEIWDPTGGLGTIGRIAALLVPGEQTNPHLFGEWVAFEDLSAGHAQVALWQWTTGLVFLPHPSASNQTLNDLGVMSGTELRVVFVDDGDGSGARHDIALYRLPYVNGAIQDDGSPNDWPWSCPTVTRPPPARCDEDYPDAGTCVCRHDDDGEHEVHAAQDDDDRDDHASKDDDEDRDDHASKDDDEGEHDDHHGAPSDRCACAPGGAAAHRDRVVLARLELSRHTGKPSLGARSFDATPYPGDAELPVLVCVDAVHATAGWLTLDDALLAGPSAFRGGVQHLERRAALHRPTGRIAGLIAGKPGASLVARVIADPGSARGVVAAQACVNEVITPALPVPTRTGVTPSSAAQSTTAAGAGAGCGNPGGAGALGGLALVALLGLRRRSTAARG